VVAGPPRLGRLGSLRVERSARPAKRFATSWPKRE